MNEQIAWLKAAADPTRLRMLAVLAHGNLSVTELTQILRQSQPRVSRHLKLLTDAGLIERSREGAWVFYHITSDASASLFVRMLLGFVESGQGELARDASCLSDVRRERTRQAERYFARHAHEWDLLRSMHGPDTPIEAAIRDAFDARLITALLDIGTGTGRMLEVMADRIGRGLGIDLSREMLGVARARLAADTLAHCQVKLGDMYALPVPDAAYDAVIVHQVLHFASDPQAAIREAARALVPGGRLVIADLARHDREALRVDHSHVWLGFDDAAITNWLAACKLNANPARHLGGGDLEVVLWSADRPGKGHA